MLVPQSTDSRFVLEDAAAARLAEEFGTPLYVIGETHLRERVREYVQACRSVDGLTDVAFASKANSTLAVLKIAVDEGALLDVASEGELRAALLAGVPASRCHLHGNNKAESEIRFAVQSGIGQIVADNFEELEVLASVAQGTEVMLRLAPGVDPVTHAKMSTGQADTKFGFNISDGSARKALARSLELGLNVVGVHCHVGSQLLDPTAQISGGDTIAEFAAQMRSELGWEARFVNVGGGLGITYLPGDKPLPVTEYCRRIIEAVRSRLEPLGMRPRIIQEPGRAMVGESGVTLYRVGSVKTVPTLGGTRTYAAVDGGLADNPRPALYGSRYEVRAVAPRSPGLAKFTVSGRHCETDRLFEDVDLPSDLARGDLLQVLCTGAYGSSMASNYNRYRRPGTVLVRGDGSFTEVQRPETWDEMFARESLPGDL